MEDAEPEGLPKGAFPGGFRPAAVPQSPTLERQGASRRGQRPSIGPPPVQNHRDARIGLEALTQVPAEVRSIAANQDEPGVELVSLGPDAAMAFGPARKGPGIGAHLAFVDPPVIACLTVVVVMRGGGRGGPWSCRGFPKSVPEDSPVPGDTA